VIAVETADPKQETTFSAFQTFNEAEWMEWLGAFLARNPQPPFIRANNDPPSSVLNRLFEALEPMSSIAFNRALFRQFEETAIIHKNSFRLYTLLHVIACTLPGQAKPLLRRRLREGVFRRLNFEGQNLHNLLLVACSKFDVDEELVRWVHRSARNSKDFGYLLLCQWVLSTVEDEQAFHFIERLIPYMNDAANRAQTTRQLYSVADRLGYYRFLDWYRERYESLQERWPREWELFVRALKERLLTDAALPILAEKDPDAALVYAEVRFERNTIPVETVLQIARLHQSLGFDTTVEVLLAIWMHLFDGEVAPWDYYSPREDHTATSPNPQGIVFRATVSGPSKISFRVDLEEETENVLIEARNQYGPLMPVKKMRAAS
jgi:hypothetical protein